MAERISPLGDVFCFDVPLCGRMNGHMESRVWGRWREEGAFGHVKGHLWGFRGPLHDRQGSASGGSNSSKMWGGAQGSHVVCCARFVWGEFYCLCYSTREKKELFNTDVLLFGSFFKNIFAYL